MKNPKTEVYCAWCGAKTSNRPAEFEVTAHSSQTQAAACLECGQLSVWDDAARVLRKPTAREAKSLERCHVTQRLKGIIDAWHTRDANAMRAQLAMLEDDQRADAGKLPLQTILDLRKHYVQRQRELFRQTLQHVTHGDDALQIMFFSLIESLETTTIIYSCDQSPPVTGRDAIARVLVQLAEAADTLKLHERVDRMVATVKKQST